MVNSMIDESNGPDWPIPADETGRLADLHALGILDTPAEQPYDGIAEIAAALFEVPYAALGFVDEARHWFKACWGTKIRQTSRRIAFCRYTILSAQTMIVEDLAEDERFKNHPLVTGALGARFYAGAPLVTHAGQCVGTLCLLDVRPRTFSPEQERLLERLASQAVDVLESRRLFRQITEILSPSAQAQDE